LELAWSKTQFIFNFRTKQAKKTWIKEKKMSTATSILGNVLQKQDVPNWAE
jgi:hypothetical protein